MLAAVAWGLSVLLLAAALACQSDDVPRSSGNEPAAATNVVTLPRHHEPLVVNSDDVVPSSEDERAASTDQVTLPRHHEPPVINSGDEYVFGELLRSGRCLRVSYTDQTDPELTRRGLLVVWPPGFRAQVSDDGVRAVDPAGHVLAKTGDTVRLSGRKLSDDSAQAPELDWDGDPEADCVGPYWLVGDEVSAGVSQYPNVNPGAEIFFPTLSHQRGPIVSMAALLEGRLELQGDCLRAAPPLKPEEFEGFVVVWPPGFGVEMQDGELAVVNGGGSVIARVGGQVGLGGGQPPKHVFDEESRCPGEIWHALSVHVTSDR